MFDKLREMQSKMDEMKKRLNDVHVNASSDDGKIRVVANANRKIVDIKLSYSQEEIDVEELEDKLYIVINQALENAEKVNEAEMQGAARDLLPGGFPSF
jgi:nucleoid-associated protein EbfC